MLQLTLNTAISYGEPENWYSRANVMSTVDGYNSGMGMDQMAKNIVNAIGNTPKMLVY